MTAFDLPITITKGVIFGPLIFNLRQDNGDPFDLTDGGTWKVFAEARRHPLANQKIDLEPEITDAENGQIVIDFTDEETFAMMGGKYKWDMVLEDPEGERTGPYFSGTMTVKEVNTHV